MLLKLYRWFSIVFVPLIDIWLLWRRLRGKEDAARYAERQGRPTIHRPEGFLLWLHAASVGEAVSVLPLITQLKLDHPAINIMVTTGTVTSAKLLAERLPAGAFHMYVPVDKYYAVKRFLQKMQPDLGLFVESELWPNLITQSHAQGVKLVQINARMSERTFVTWQKYKSLSEAMLGCFSLSLAQSEADAERLSQLGAKDVRMLGNLKFDAPNLPTEPAAIGALIRQIAGRPLFVAASTHPGEEEQIRYAANCVSQNFPNLLTIIIPRHPSRGHEVAKLCGKSKYVVQRSKNVSITPQTRFYIADTIGELGLFYRVASIVYMGGSLVEHGGQNPLEAARLECALITGNHTKNFADIYEELVREGACLRVENAHMLATTLGALLHDREKVAEMAHTGLQLMEGKRGVLQKYREVLDPLLTEEQSHAPA